jgi:hypothetical protein
MGPSDLRWKTTLCTGWIWISQVPGYNAHRELKEIVADQSLENARLIKEVEQMRKTHQGLKDCNDYRCLSEFAVGIVPRVKARAKHALHILVIIISFRY